MHRTLIPRSSRAIWSNKKDIKISFQSRMIDDYSWKIFFFFYWNNWSNFKWCEGTGEPFFNEKKNPFEKYFLGNLIGMKNDEGKEFFLILSENVEQFTCVELF